MRITLFTSNQYRHNYLINLLSSHCSQLCVVQETRTILPGLVNGHYPVSQNMQKYFFKVKKAEEKLFGKSYIKMESSNFKLITLQAGDINNLTIKDLKDFLNSDIYIVFGSSYIKGELIDFLVENFSINIHMGVSPYYRGTDCNFWALYDDNPHLVGATIHKLTKGLDNGPILLHSMSEIKNNSFEYSMSCVLSAFISIINKIKDKSIFDIDPEDQSIDKQIRYSKKNDFNDNILDQFFKKKINLNFKKFDNLLLKNPFFLKEDY